MAFQEEGNIQIHTENIFPIIKKAVYSDHEIFLRELISNSLDAISKRRMASIAGDCKNSEEAKISISINKENQSITISDNGIGMSASEVKKYINQVAFSSAEEFLEKYKQNKEGIIGHFGLGFYSSFMVADNVQIVTKSAIGNEMAVKWECDGSPKFKIKEHERNDIGTDITLFLMEDEKEYLEPERIKVLIKKYCDFMPIAIELEGECINKKNSIWRKSAKELNEKDYIELYHYLYPYQGEPLIWIHLNTDYPYKLQGILYFPKITGRADWEQGEIKLFCNQVFVSDSIKEVVPRYLLPLRGVIDSPDIPLNVSRSALQTDRRVRSIGQFISKKVGDKLKSIKKESPEFYSEVWESTAPFIKIGAMEDEKFSEQVNELILFPTSIDKSETSQSLIQREGKVYTNIDDYLDRLTCKENKKVIYCTDEISQANALNHWKQQGTEIIIADTVIDAQFIPWLEEKYKEITFQRVDSELSYNQNENENEIADKDGKTDSEKLQLLISEAIGNNKVSIQVQSLNGAEAPPAIILLPEQMRRINDLGAIMQQKLPGLPDNHILVVNKNHKLIKNLIKLHAGDILINSVSEDKNKNLSNNLVNYIYDMARLEAGGIRPDEINELQRTGADLMSKLLEKIF